ncbi:MAG: hypothetical protein N3A38_16425 [Planctomycetota bacterium]|nr:hypothetical protein [Planctomycetota bacterium]
MGRRKVYATEIVAGDGMIGSALDRTIAEAVELEARAAELQGRIEAGRRRIREIMERLNLERRETPEGHAALLSKAKVYEWDVSKLAEVLSPDEALILCPRKPDPAALRRLMESDPARRKVLRQCAKAITISRLTLKASGKGGSKAGHDLEVA